MSGSHPSTILHASAVALNGRAALIIGPSGSGKSAFALRLITLGAVLVSDDRTVVAQQAGQAVASAPDALLGLIEARGVGIFKTAIAKPTPVVLAVDLGVAETKRLPEPHQIDVAGITVPCFHRVDAPHFRDAILLCLRYGIFPSL